MLPKLLYVYEEKDGDETYYMTNDTIDGAAFELESKPREVGVYQLVSRRTIKRTVETVKEVKLK